MQPVRLPWDLQIVQHRREFHKPSNTARWLETVVENCERWVHAVRGDPIPPDRFEGGEVPRYVLFPSDESRVLGREELAQWALGRPRVGIVVLDGTWRHASRMVRRIEGLNRLERVSLPPGPPSRWPMRRATNPERLCTFEAVLRLSVLAGDHETAARMEAAFQALLNAQSASRDQPRPPGASGG